MIAALAPELMAGQSAQVFVNDGDQQVRSLGAARAGLAQKLRDGPVRGHICLPDLSGNRRNTLFNLVCTIKGNQRKWMKMN